MLVVSPAIHLPIQSETVNIEIIPTSKYGKAYDTAKISNTIILSQPLQTEQAFLVPKLDALTSPQITLSDGSKISCDSDVIDEGALNALKQKLSQDIQSFEKGPNSQNASLSIDEIREILEIGAFTTEEKIPAQTRIINFSYDRAITPNGTTFSLDSIVPLASFTLQNGGRINLMVEFPFDPLVQAPNVQGTWINTSNQTQPLQPANVGNRTVLSAFWQQDPKLSINYHY